MKSNIRKLAFRLLRRMLAGSSTRLDLVRLGSDYGGWCVPSAMFRHHPGLVAYCAGAGENISFDLALLERGCVVTVFDPTPRAREYVASIAPRSDRFRFVPIGWWDSEASIRFYAPRDATHVSHAAVNLQGTTEYFTAAVESVSQLAAELGDPRIHLMKMDIEGAEYRVIDSLLREGPKPEVLCVEFHPHGHLRATFSARRLRSASYELESMDRWNCTFVRKGWPAQDARPR